MTWAAVQGAVGSAIAAFSSFVLVYFLAMNLSYILLFLVSLSEVLRFLRRTFFSDYQQILKSDMTLPISLLVPAHNEERGIAETVQNLLLVDYPDSLRKVVVVADNCTDNTARSIDGSLRVDLILEKAVDGVQHAVDRAQCAIDGLQSTTDDIADGCSDAVDRGHNGRPIDKLAPCRLWCN